MKIKVKEKMFCLGIAAVIVITLSVVVSLALWSNNQPYIGESSTQDIREKMYTISKSGGEVEFTSNDINKLMALLFSKDVRIGKVTMKGLYTKLYRNKITLFFPITIGNVKLLPNTSGGLFYENDKLIYKPASFKIGKLPIPKFLVFSKIRFSGETIRLNKGRVEIDKSIIPFKITSGKTIGDKLVLTIEKLKAGVIIGNNYNKQEENIDTPSNEWIIRNNNDKSKGVGEGNKSDTEEPLEKVSRQLNDAISVVKSPQGKKILSKIQIVVDKVIKNPKYNYRKEAAEVKAAYKKLSPKEKLELKDAIMYNIDFDTLLLLLNVFGS